MIRNSCVLVPFVCASLTTLACEREPLSGPPTLRLGRDECLECGMSIMEDRCSTAMLVECAGQRSHRLFDDIGCMLDVEDAGIDGCVVLERYVHDHGTRDWVAAEEALFLVTDSDALTTPMGSGLVAFARREDAERAQAEHGGAITDLAGAAIARRTWLEERRRRHREEP